MPLISLEIYTSKKKKTNDYLFKNNIYSAIKRQRCAPESLKSVEINGGAVGAQVGEGDVEAFDPAELFEAEVQRRRAPEVGDTGAVEPRVLGVEG